MKKLGNYKEKALDILKNNLIFFIGTILLMYKGIFLNCLLSFEVEMTMIWYIVLASLLIMCPVINHKNKFAFLYANIAYAVITLLIYANFLYYSYSTNFISFYQIENLKYAKEIGSGLSCVITVKSMLWFWVDNIIIAGLSVFAYRKWQKTFYDNKVLKIIVIIIILVLNVWVVQSYINDIYQTKGYNKSLIVEEASIYYYHYEDAKDYFSSMFLKEKVDEEKLSRIYQENLEQKKQTTEYTGASQDSNVIILQLESLNEYVIGKKVKGKEITPNLNAFFRDNIYCSDMYNQGLGSTADSEFEMANSMYPLENGYVFQKYYGNDWLDIYTTLQNRGYYTSFMHPNTSTFWNREEVYNVGYHIDEYNDISCFPDIEPAGGFYSDEGFLKEAVSIMASYEGKFCSTLVTISNHIPFYLTGVSNLEDKTTITRDDVADFGNEIFENYIISCNFMDFVFGEFIKDLEETGLINNSILVVYGDHGSGLTDIEQIKMLYGENEIDYTEFEHTTKDVHIPFGIKIPGIESNETIQRAVSKIDIKPTLLDLLGIEDNFSIGTSIFSKKDYSFIKGLGYVTSKYYCINDKYYNRDTYEEIEETEELKSLLQKMEDEIYLSDTIIKNDLLK